jgi:MFS family permease
MNKNSRKIIFLSSVGGALEFFDFTIYALFAPYISVAFFPSENKFISLIATFAVFAVGYFARPLGGVVFGHIGDKKGRRFAFSLSVLLMALATLLIGCLPTYQTWGLLAPMLLILLRLMQGFSVGGEIPGATIFTAEHIPMAQRGFAVGTVFMFVTLGNAIASSIGLTLVKLLSHQAMQAWGWRIPFVIGFLLGLVGYIIRKKALETPLFTELEVKKMLLRIPVLESLKHAKQQLMVGFLLTALSAATIFIFLYLPTYLTTILHYQIAYSYLLSTISFITLALCGPLCGFLSDKIGRKKVLIWGSILCIVVGYVLFKQLIAHGFLMPWLFVIGMGIIVALVNGTYGIAICEQFSPAFRASGMGLSYNLGFAIFGGLAPLASTYFIHVSGSAMAPYYYLLVCGLLTLFASLCFNNVVHKHPSLTDEKSLPLSQDHSLQ